MFHVKHPVGKWGEGGVFVGGGVFWGGGCVVLGGAFLWSLGWVGSAFCLLAGVGVVLLAECCYRVRFLGLLSY